MDFGRPVQATWSIEKSVKDGDVVTVIECLPVTNVGEH